MELNQFEESEFDLYYEMQYWLMLNQSACIRGAASLHSWNLFYRCFGVREVAITQFREYLQADIPKPNIDKYLKGDLLSDYEKTYFSLRAVCASYDVYCLRRKTKEEILSDPSTLRSFATSVITSMIEESGVKYDEVKVYVYRDRYFCQIRFIYRTKDCWQDDAELIGKASNYDKLIELHAVMELMSDTDVDRLNEHDDGILFYFIDESKSYNNNDSLWNDACSNEIIDEDTLHYRYQKWKDQIVSI